jgi:phage gp36-like protein
MPYATPTELRARFTRDEDDEFAALADSELLTALEAATAEIDSYRPAAELSAAGTAVLKEKCLVLARMLVHRDAALEAIHPIVRDARAVRDWLRDLAAGRARLPAGDGSGTSGGTGAEWTAIPTVWGRGAGGGL